MHEGSQDNLRASPVPAVQAMMTSRLRNVLPPMINKRERLSWYYPTLIRSATPNWKLARSIARDNQTGIP